MLQPILAYLLLRWLKQQRALQTCLEPQSSILQQLQILSTLQAPLVSLHFWCTLLVCLFTWRWLQCCHTHTKEQRSFCSCSTSHWWQEGAPWTHYKGRLVPQSCWWSRSCKGSFQSSPPSPEVCSWNCFPAEQPPLPKPQQQGAAFAQAGCPSPHPHWEHWAPCEHSNIFYS